MRMAVHVQGSASFFMTVVLHPTAVGGTKEHALLLKLNLSPLYVHAHYAVYSVILQSCRWR